MLAHHFESAGLPTTQISLIRPHTEHIRPPRAVWVPFILGRPLGQPADPGFQLRVLRRALSLFDEPHGPVLVDHDEEATGEIELDGMSCPISWARVEHDGSLRERMLEEVDAMRSWYDLGVERSGRTAFGVAGLSIEAAVETMAALTDGESPTPPDAIPLGEWTRLIAEDLKAFVTEAAAAQPGTMSAYAIKAWFWDQTAIGEGLLEAYRASASHADETVRSLAPTMIPKELR